MRNRKLFSRFVSTFNTKTTDMSKLNKKQRLLDRIERKGNLMLSNESLSLNELTNNELLNILSELEWGISKGVMTVKNEELSWSLQKK